MKAKFKLGDVVMLKSGSPIMTIAEIITPVGDHVIKYNATFCDETTNIFKRALGLKEFQLERCNYLTMNIFKRLFSKSVSNNPEQIQSTPIEPTPVQPAPVQMTKLEFMAPWRNKHNQNEPIQIRTLRRIIFHLMREIEALRETKIEEAKLAGMSPKNSVYAQMYEQVCLKSHNNSSWTPLEMKVSQDWFHTEQGIDQAELDELLILKKLGYSDVEVQEYLDKVEEVGQYT